MMRRRGEYMDVAHKEEVYELIEGVGEEDE